MNRAHQAKGMNFCMDVPKTKEKISIWSTKKIILYDVTMTSKFHLLMAWESSKIKAPRTNYRHKTYLKNENPKHLLPLVWFRDFDFGCRLKLEARADCYGQILFKSVHTGGAGCP